MVSLDDFESVDGNRYGRGRTMLCYLDDPSPVVLNRDR